jgi:hypothetical protein
MAVTGKISGDDVATSLSGVIMAGIQAGENVGVPSALFGSAYTTTTVAAAATIPASVQRITTNGYATQNDKGHGSYKRYSLASLTTGLYPAASYFRSVDRYMPDGSEDATNGGYWVLDEREVTLEQFGGVADGVWTASTISGTDNQPAFKAALAYGLANAFTGGFGGTPTVRLGMGTYRINSTVYIPYNTRIVGAGGGGQGSLRTATRLVYPADVAGFHITALTSINPDTGLAFGTIGMGSILENFSMTAVAGGTDRTAHAIIYRSRAVVRNVNISLFAGNGHDINTVTAEGGDSSANVNNWEIYGGRVSDNQIGIYTNGPDSNAGCAFHVDCYSNRQAGILDSSFLGNNYFGCHENGNGALAGVVHGGNRYRANPTVALVEDPSPLSTTEPGTDGGAIWELIGAGGIGDAYPTAWESGGEYYVGGQKISINSNARTIFFGGYSEQSWPPSFIIFPAAIIGGFNNASIHENSTGAVFTDNDWTGLRSSTGQSFTAARSVAELDGFEIENQASLGTSRRARFATYIGLKDDGETRRPCAAFTGRPASGATTDSGIARIEYHDAGTDDWNTAIDFNGDTLFAVPGTTNVWTFGSSSLLWLKGWFGNLSLFPAASVSPTVNGELTFQLTADNELALKVQGSDGTDRTGTVPMTSANQQATVNDEADFTLTPGTSAPNTKHTGTLTSDVALTLSTTGATRSTVWRITRTGSGAFNLNVGTGPLKALAVNTWCEVRYDGSAYYLAAYGAL